jgi:hypothetical protein
VDEPQTTRGVTVRIFFAAAAGSILAVGLFGAVFALFGHKANTSIAVAYYIIGAILVIAGGFPTGGLSFVRMRMTRRQPTGSSGYALPSMLLGAVLIGVGVLVDLYKPF